MDLLINFTVSIISQYVYTLNYYNIIHQFISVKLKNNYKKFKGKKYNLHRTVFYQKKLITVISALGMNVIFLKFCV